MESTARVTLGPGALILILVTFGGCAPQDPTPENWQEPCQNDGECGSLLCLSGSCTVTCRTDRDCDKSTEEAVRCYEAVAPSDDSTSSFVGVCGAASAVRGDAVASQALVAELDEVGSCPEVARTTGLPPVIVQATATDYEGPAIVADVRAESFAAADSVATVTLTEQPGAELLVHYSSQALGQPFTVGAEVTAFFRTGGEQNLFYSLLVLRDATGRLLLARHSGADALYQAGLFATPDVTGFQLTLDPLCRSAVDDGCFQHQTQAEYRGTFIGDARLEHDGSNVGVLSLGGNPYTVQFWSSSVDGGKPLCTGVSYPSRYLDFTVF